MLDSIAGGNVGVVGVVPVADEVSATFFPPMFSSGVVVTFIVRYYNRFIFCSLIEYQKSNHKININPAIVKV